MRETYQSSAFLFICLAVFSCKKPDVDNVGLGLQPEDDKIYSAVTDTLTLNIRTEKADSLSTDELSEILAGNYHTNYGGSFTVESFVQMRLPANNLIFEHPNDLVADSVVLYLSASSYYGDTTLALNYSVKRVIEDIYLDSSYKSNAAQPMLGDELVLLANKTQTVSPNAQLVVGADTIPGGALRLKLNPQIAQDIFALSGGTELSNTDAFLDYFKGLYITTEDVGLPNNGVVYGYNPASVYSRVRFFYRDTVTVTPDSVLKIDFLINSSSARFNRFVNNTAGSEVETYLAQANATEKTIIQSGGTFWTHIDIPALKEIPFGTDEGSIAKAELVFPVNLDAHSGEFVPHERMYVLGVKEDGTAFLLDDFITEGDAFFGGYYDESTKTYRFRITRYVQDVLYGSRKNYGLRLQAAFGGVTSNRTVLNTQKALVGERPKLVLYYSEF